MHDEPLRESGYRLAMRACVARGNQAEALRIYGVMRRRIAEELGVDPGPASRALFEEILAESSVASAAVPRAPDVTPVPCPTRVQHPASRMSESGIRNDSGAEWTGS